MVMFVSQIRLLFDVGLADSLINHPSHMVVSCHVPTIMKAARLLKAKGMDLEFSAV